MRRRTIPFDVRCSDDLPRTEATCGPDSAESGFDPAEAIQGRGLDLTSMGERLKLVHGDLSIDSTPEQGTTIHARVPISPSMKIARVAG